MNHPETAVEVGCRRQVALLKQLRDCLELERESLIQVDVEQLWELMEKKNSLVVEIGNLGNEITGMLHRHFSGSGRNARTGALKAWPWFRDFSKKTARLREEIQVRLGENQSFIQDTLGFFNELMGIILNSGAPSQGYGNRRKAIGAKTPRIYLREV